MSGWKGGGGGGGPQIESGGKVSGRSERGGIAADWLSVHNAHLYFCIYIFLLSYPDTQNVYLVKTVKSTSQCC